MTIQTYQQIPGADLNSLIDFVSSTDDKLMEAVAREELAVMHDLNEDAVDAEIEWRDRERRKTREEYAMSVGQGWGF
jgi:hypothetical protein